MLYYHSFLFIFKRVKQQVHSFTSILLAFLILASTSGVHLDMHFCQDKLKRVNLFGPAKTCAEVAALSKSCCAKKMACHKQMTDVATADHDDCCRNSTLSFDLSVDALAPVIIQEESIELLDLDVLQPSILSKANVVNYFYSIPIIYPPPEILQGVSKPIIYGSFLC